MNFITYKMFITYNMKFSLMTDLTCNMRRVDQSYIGLGDNFERPKYVTFRSGCII